MQLMMIEEAWVTRITMPISIEPWGSWRPLEPVDDALSAVIDVELDDDDRIVRVTLACGPLLADATRDDLDRYVLEEVNHRLQRLVDPAAGSDVDGWSVSSLGHLQLTLMERWLPEF